MTDEQRLQILIADRDLLIAQINGLENIDARFFIHNRLAHTNRQIDELTASIELKRRNRGMSRAKVLLKNIAQLREQHRPAPKPNRWRDIIETVNESVARKAEYASTGILARALGGSPSPAEIEEAHQLSELDAMAKTPRRRNVKELLGDGDNKRVMLSETAEQEYFGHSASDCPYDFRSLHRRKAH